MLLETGSRESLALGLLPGGSTGVLVLIRMGRLLPSAQSQLPLQRVGCRGHGGGRLHGSQCPPAALAAAPARGSSGSRDQSTFLPGFPLDRAC